MKGLDMTGTAPDGYTPVAPRVVTDDTSWLLDFVSAAFGGRVLSRLALEDGNIGHAEIRVGDTVVRALTGTSTGR
jgi:PhnB protein